MSLYLDLHRPEGGLTVRKLIVLALSIVFLGGCSLLDALRPPELPTYQEPKETMWLNQNWENDDRFWYHHTPQGTQTVPVPYPWFLALEQPELFPKGALLRDPDYLSRIGFIPSPRGATYETAQDVAAYGFSAERQGEWGVDFRDQDTFEGNPGGLPVGFAMTRDQQDPFTGFDLPPMLGFTCATCHTGQLTYQGTNIRIDGGPAMIDLFAFTEVIGVSMAYTKIIPGRFGRFADRVLGEGASKEDKKALKKQFDAFLEQAQVATKPLAKTAVDGVPEGFARLDALNRIGTQLFFSDLAGHTPAGFDPTVNIADNDAPVNYPHIWSTGWFDWVQYDSSIMQPMIRNAGESLGVRALANLSQPDGHFDSTVLVEDLFDMEDLLSGTQPTEQQRRFNGLKAPRWPQGVLGAIDTAKARRGELLYQQHCQACHLPSVQSDEFWSSEFWGPLPDATGDYLKLQVLPVDVIGTDPQQAKVLRDRQVRLPSTLEIPNFEQGPGGVICGPEAGSSPQPVTSFAWALAYATEQVIENRYRALDIPESEWDAKNGFRPNCVRAPYAYKARPLNGVWATAPFLHNGSVLTLHDLLGPASARAKTVCLGDREFDPVKVGMLGRCLKGTTKFDTTKLGNLASGHSFEDSWTGKPENGVIGPALSDDDRMALIEFLKTQ